MTSILISTPFLTLYAFTQGRGGRGNGKDGKEKVELGPPPEDGIVYRDCEIKGVHTFGVFVEMLPGYEGLVHISEIEMNKVNVNDLQNMFKQGDKIDVKFLGKNEKGQMRLSRRAVLMRDAPTPASVSSGAATAAPTPMKPAEPSAAVRATSAAEEAYGS
jgi:polyribonucleotide nucleotidyltransferase